MVVYALYGVAALLALAPIAIALGASPRGSNVIYGASLIVTLMLGVIALLMPVRDSDKLGRHVAARPAVARRAFPHRRALRRSSWSWSISAARRRACSRSAMAVTKHSPQRVLPFYPAYLAGMNLVVLADDAFSFLVSWEFMSLTSWALVIAHHRVRENLRAGYVYLLMASFGTLALLLAFGLLAGADGNYAFDAIRAAHPSAGLAALVLILALVGAGSKAGLVPLHAWLPLAHPAAPSHVSALMSGVMTKVAVYGFVRIVFDLLGPPAWWWSMRRARRSAASPR